MISSQLVRSRPKVAAAIHDAGDVTQRQIALSVLRHVLENHVPLHNADEITNAVSGRHFGDSQLRDDVWNSHLAAEDRYLDYAEEIDDVGRSGRPRDAGLVKKAKAEHRVHTAFLVAYYALDPDPEIAAAQVVYYAALTTGGYDEILGFVEGAIGSG